MFKLLHPLEKIGFIGMLISLICLLILPFVPVNEKYISIAILVPAVIALVFSGCLLLGQQFRTRKNKKLWNAMHVSPEQSRNSFKETADVLRRISENSKRSITPPK